MISCVEHAQPLMAPATCIHYSLCIYYYFLANGINVENYRLSFHFGLRKPIANETSAYKTKLTVTERILVS